VLQRFAIFAVGLIALVVFLAPSLDKMALDKMAPGHDGPTASASPTATFAAGPEVNAVGGGFAIDRDGSGQFHVQAMVNDQPLRLLVDTGADGLALSEADARTLGIAPDPSQYAQVVTTASGPGYGAHVHVDRLDVGGHDLGGADAVVVRGLGTSLMGQSVLRRLGPVTLSGDRMFIGSN
jgi:aspartyl protease family protein